MLSVLDQKETRAYIFLTALVMCGLASSIITGSKLISISGISFPFSNITFSIFTYPIIDCICELWGKKVARQTLWIALTSQLLIALLIQISILAPASHFWHLQDAYKTILSISGNIIIASLIAFTFSQIVDLVIYQRIKELSQGKNFG